MRQILNFIIQRECFNRQDRGEFNYEKNLFRVHKDEFEFAKFLREKSLLNLFKSLFNQIGAKKHFFERNECSIVKVEALTI